MILAAIVVPGYLLANRHLGGGDDPVQSELERKVAGLTESLEDPKTGISARWPEAWEQQKRDGAFVFRSPDRRLAISISTPAPARDADDLRKGVISTIEEEYRKATVRHGKGRTIGGLPAKGAVIEARRRSGDRLRILVAVAKGRKRAYLLEVLTAPETRSDTLVDGQLILSSVQLGR